MVREPRSRSRRKVIQELHRSIDQADVLAATKVNSASIDAYRRWSEQLTEAEIRVIAAESKLNQLRAEDATHPPARRQGDG